nr:pilus biosynthesis protein TadE [Mycobacterium avium subsp. paratuberculosis]
MLVACLAGVTAVAMQVRCVDAAREAARLAARGDVRLGPAGARVDLRRDGDLLVATVVAHSKLLPALDIRAQAVSAAEPAR